MSMRQSTTNINNSIFKPSDTRLSTQPSYYTQSWTQTDGWMRLVNGVKRRTRTAASEQRNSNSRSPEDDVKLPTWMMKYSRGEEINTKVTIRPSKQISVKRERSKRSIIYLINHEWRKHATGMGWCFWGKARFSLTLEIVNLLKQFRTCSIILHKPTVIIPPPPLLGWTFFGIGTWFIE